MLKPNIVLFIFTILFLSVKAQKQTESSIILAEADKIESKMIAWRRDFHQHPELGNSEKRTAKIIAAHLRSLGLEVKENIAKTGVTALLKGSKPGPCIGLRADIDGLPITERTNLSFASREKTTYNGLGVGIMHACGHDTHIAILMSVAEILTGMKDKLKGSVKFIFQPAEEGPPEGEEGGAPLMIKEGVLENPKVDLMFGLHINSATESGKIKYRSGGIMAASDWFTIKVKGKGSHGSQPWTAIDPVVVAAQIINNLQTIISRQTDLTKNAAVISVCIINGGIRANIIPETVEMTGTIRTLDTGMQTLIHQKIRTTAIKTAESAGAEATVEIDKKTLVTYNDPALMKKMLPSFQRSAGEKNVVEMDAVTGAEDFSFFAEKVPAIFFFLGGMNKGQEPDKAFPHHTPDFILDESGMKLGVITFCNLVMDYQNNR